MRKQSKVWEWCNQNCLGVSVRQPYAWSPQPKKSQCIKPVLTYSMDQTCLSGQRNQGGQGVFPGWKGSRWTDCVPWYHWTGAHFQAGQNQQLPSSCNSLPTSYSPEHITFTTSTITIITAELNLQVLRTIYKLINCFSFMTPQRRQMNWSSITQPKKKFIAKPEIKAKYDKPEIKASSLILAWTCTGAISLPW